MAFAERLPHPALRPFIDRFWVRTPEAGAATPGRILPDGCIDLVIDACAARSFVVGTMTAAVVMQAEATAALVGVRFRPGGAVPFLRTPAAALTDRRVAGQDLQLGWLLGRLDRGFAAHVSDLSALVLGLEAGLLAHLAAVAPPDPLVAHAVRALFAEAPPRIADLSHELGWSRQHLARRFAHEVGVTPKELGRIARLHRAIVALQSRAGRPKGQKTLAAVAADCGYFDEAHMAGDFSRLGGVTPGAAQVAAGSIFPIRSLLTGA